MSNPTEIERSPIMLVKHWDWYHECFQISCTLQRDPSMQRKIYCSRIKGSDPNYILARDFVERSHIVSGSNEKFYFSLMEDGIYEFVLKTLDSQSGKLISVDRRWLIILGSDLYEYDGWDFSNQYVLYTLYNLELQSPADDDLPPHPASEDPQQTDEPHDKKPQLRLL